MSRLVYLPPRWRVNLDTMTVERFTTRRATGKAPALEYWSPVDRRVDTSSIIAAAKEKDAATNAL